MTPSFAPRWGRRASRADSGARQIVPLFRGRALGAARVKCSPRVPVPKVFRLLPRRPRHRPDRRARRCRRRRLPADHHPVPRHRRRRAPGDVIAFQIVDQRLAILLGHDAADHRGGHLATGAFDVDHFAGIGADDGRTVQVVKALAGGRADALRAPFGIGHFGPFEESGFASKALACHRCGRLSKAFLRLAGAWGGSMLARPQPTLHRGVMPASARFPARRNHPAPVRRRRGGFRCGCRGLTGG